MTVSAGPLSGRCIAVPESRQLDLFARMLASRAATTWRCPLVDIHDAPDPAPVRAWIDEVLTHGVDDMIWLTGEGVRRLDAFCERDPELDAAALWRRLGAARTFTRGPKPVRELRPRGINTDMAAPEPTTAGVIDSFAGLDLDGHRVGVQLYGADPNTALMTALAERGARALPVAPYVYADDAATEAVTALISAIVEARVDAVAFTSSPQVERLFKVARRHDREAGLRGGLNGLCVAAVGPRVAATLADYGVGVDLMPESNYFMKPLVRALGEYFTHRAVAPASSATPKK